jgi:hypothetical protein
MQVKEAGIASHGRVQSSLHGVKSSTGHENSIYLCWRIFSEVGLRGGSSGSSTLLDACCFPFFAGALALCFAAAFSTGGGLGFCKMHKNKKTMLNE